MRSRITAFFVSFAAIACTPAAAPEKPPLDGARIGGPFALVDENGRAVTDRSYAGSYRIVYFGYTFCPDVCPTDMQMLGQALRMLDASDPALSKRIVPLFVTVDPERDTPAVLRTYTAAFYPRLIGLTGTPGQIAQAAQEYAVSYSRGPDLPGGGYVMGHSAVAYLMSPDDKPLALLSVDTTADQVVTEIKRWAA